MEDNIEIRSINSIDLFIENLYKFIWCSIEIFPKPKVHTSIRKILYFHLIQFVLLAKRQKHYVLPIISSFPI